MKQQNVQKKNKYIHPCQEKWKDFNLMVYSNDEMTWREARGAEKCLASYLATKWGWPYSQMVHYVRVWMATTVVHSNSLLLQGSHNQDTGGT